MENSIRKPDFSHRKTRQPRQRESARPKGQTVSLYFNKNDVWMYKYIEVLSERYKVAKGRIVMEMLKSLGMMTLFAMSWDNKLKGKKSQKIEIDLFPP